MINNKIKSRICFQQNIYYSIFCSVGSFDKSESRAATIPGSFSSAMILFMQQRNENAQ